MNIFKFILTVTLLAPSLSFAAFNLDAVENIECTDLNANSEMNVEFSTSTPAAKKYQRNHNEIPYSYQNMNAYVFASGVLTLQNNPDEENGTILLTDGWDSIDPVKLVLKPTQEQYKYIGMLTGGVEDKNQEWVTITDYPLHCIVK